MEFHRANRDNSWEYLFNEAVANEVKKKRFVDDLDMTGNFSYFIFLLVKH